MSVLSVFVSCKLGAVIVSVSNAQPTGVPLAEHCAALATPAAALAGCGLAGSLPPATRARLVTLVPLADNTLTLSTKVLVPPLAIEVLDTQ